MNTSTPDSDCRVPDLDPSVPLEVIPALPYLLGFDPFDSLVGVFHDHDRTIGLTLRVDWSDCVADPSGVAAVIASRGRFNGDTSTMLFVCQPSSGQWRDVLFDVDLGLALAGVNVTWQGIISGSEWQTPRCPDAGCEPHGLDTVHVSSLVTLLVSQGRSPAGSRDVLRGEVAADPLGPVPQRRVPQGAAREAWRDRTVEAATRALLSGGQAGPRALALIAAACSDIRVRDTVLWRLTRTAGDDPTVWHRVWPVLVSALRRAPAGAVAPVGAVAALVAWQCGDGARANACLDRALGADPSHGLAVLIRRSLDGALHPSAWSTVMATLEERDCRWGRGAAA